MYCIRWFVDDDWLFSTLVSLNRCFLSGWCCIYCGGWHLVLRESKLPQCLVTEPSDSLPDTYWHPQSPPPVTLFTLPTVPPPPQNVKLVRKSPTTIEVSWEQPRLATIIGYRVYYNMYALPNMADWMHLEIGPYTVTEIGGLEPHSSYAVRVQAKLQSKSYGNYSDIVVTNTVSQGKWRCMMFWCENIRTVDVFIVVSMYPPGGTTSLMSL